MFKIPKQEYTAEFKELAARRVRSGQGIAAVARELGLIEQTLRNWVKAAKAGKLNPPGTKAITPSRWSCPGYGRRTRACGWRMKSQECE
jgi:transposase